MRGNFTGSKYKNKRTIYKGVEYDSRHEAECAQMLDIKQKTGLIKDVQRQVIFELVPKPNKISYKADFVIEKYNGQKMVVEAKGFWTAVAKIKMKLFKHFYPEYEVEIY